jgi:hypothetical protein
MTMVKMISGGGLTSNKLVQSRKGKVEPKAKAVSVEATAQQGMSTAFKKNPLYGGKGYEPQKVGPTGVGKATVRPETPGPGSGRTTYAKGTQGLYGPINPGIPKPAPRDILSEFGPEKSKS